MVTALAVGHWSRDEVRTWSPAHRKMRRPFKACMESYWLASWLAGWQRCSRLGRKRLKANLIPWWAGSPSGLKIGRPLSCAIWLCPPSFFFSAKAGWWAMQCSFFFGRPSSFAHSLSLASPLFEPDVFLIFICCQTRFQICTCMLHIHTHIG